MKIKKNNKNIYRNFDNEQNIRENKLIIMKKKGFNFPNDFKKSTTSKKIHDKYSEKNIDELKILNIQISISGRMMRRRIMGKASFFTIQDMDGEIQIYIQEKEMTAEFYNECFKKLDIGDILGIKGILFKTKTGELSVFCKTLNILTKSLKPLPDKFHGLSNQEIRYRQRYLDLISNNKLFHIFKNRSRIIMEIRNFMTEKNFLEVETPMLHRIPGGANARPFITHHNEIDEKMYLRIAPELYLKKLIIGGFERIFELNRNFRNEGVSSRHNPEFTMMEAYISYSKYEEMMELLENLCSSITKSLFGSSIIKYNNHCFDFRKSFNRLTMKDAVLQFNSHIKCSDLDNIEKLKKIAKSIGIKVKKDWKIGKLTTEIFEKTVEKKLIQPTFITQYPVEVSPLSRRNDINKNVTDRFELFIAGYEIANGFSELNDVEDQKERFLNQIKTEENEKEKSIFYDQDYIEAMKYGLPPTSGLGVGIDRLIMILTNQSSIREVILFPTLRSSHL